MSYYELGVGGGVIALFSGNFGMLPDSMKHREVELGQRME